MGGDVSIINHDSWRRNRRHGRWGKCVPNEINDMIKDTDQQPPSISDILIGITTIDFCKLRCPFSNLV